MRALKNNVITYTVNKKAKTDLYISVQNGEVVISAPWYMANSQIQKIVEEKKQWIITKIAEYEENRKNEEINLDKVKVLGKEYLLKIIYKNEKLPSLYVESKQIVVILPNKYKKIENSQIIKAITDKMYTEIAEKEIEKAMEKTRILTGIAPEDYEIIKINGVLAKCEDKKIIINPFIAKYNKEIIEYIILHEFCHLKYKNHTKSFYNMLKTYCPNYEEYAEKIAKMQY